MTNPNPPLWKAMHDAFLDQTLSGPHAHKGFAAELRAIAEKMVMHFDPWLQGHVDVYDWLLDEADRAEAEE